MLRTKITGLKSLRAKIDKHKLATKLSSRTVLNNIADRHIARMIKGMQESPATGRTYFRAGRAHTASAASGKAYPRIDTGALVRSMRKVSNQHSVSVRVNSPYARKLEYGDLSQNLMPRPFFYRSYRSAVRSVAKDLRQTYKGML